MKLLCLVLFMMSAYAFGQSTQSVDTLTKFTIDFDYWEGCETGKSPCMPLVFNRGTEKDSINLIMPCGGTGTTVQLFVDGSEEPIRTTGVYYDDCPPTFDLTGLADGMYSAYMTACGLGGEVKFKLTTE